MKIVGIVVSILGGLLLLSAGNVALKQYNLDSTHDISKAMGGFAFAILVLALGLYLFQRGSKPAKKPLDQ